MAPDLQFAITGSGRQAFEEITLMPQCKRTALYDVHVAQGARMIRFGDWEMPVEYSSIAKEHEAIRRRIGIFDVSHMGEFSVRGSGALDLLQHATLGAFQSPSGRLMSSRRPRH